MKIKYFLLAILFFQFSSAHAEKWVEVSGSADLTAGKKTARRLALVDAYRKAIDAGGMIKVESYSKMQDFEMVADVVSTKAHGYIKSYEVLLEGISPRDSELYFVNIKAAVVDSFENSQDNDQGLKTLISVIGVPKVLFLLSEKGSENQYSHAEQYFAEIFNDVGYDVLTSDILLANSKLTKKDVRLAKSGDMKYISKVALAVGADIVISSQVSSELSKMSGGTDIEAKLGIVILTSKAIVPSSGKVIDVSSSRERFMSVQAASSLDAIQGAVKKAVRKVANGFKWQIPKLLSQAPRSIQIKVDKISFSKNQNLKEVLENVSGVQKVEQISWENEVATFSLDVSFTGPKEPDIAQAIIKGDTKLKVVKLSDYLISLAY